MSLSPLERRAEKIRLLLLDVDGVLTDNRLFYGDNGIEYKAFHTRDGHGMVLLQQAGLDIGIITGRTSEVVTRRMADLKVKYVYQGVPDKLPTFEALMKECGLTPEQVAYMGDDILDLPILRRVGLAAMPANGDPTLRHHVHFVSQHPGGQGAVRELCELILKAQGRWEEIMAFYLR
ncbi:HAD family hydrolase [Sulfurivirga sp.]|uniref:KdsC family phosphatase n=1 Tax=Sulfurivirga sp. TaxID=2614236 RepID=UPI0025E4D56B|nr:HAD hydrolase family protein [Sulfurivirga sp.]